MIETQLDRVRLLARTSCNLRPAQVLHRVRLRAQRFPPSRPLASSLLGLGSAGRTATLPGWPSSFTPLDLRLARGYPSAEENVRGRFEFLNEPRDLGVPLNWDVPGTSRLWRYHLHYVEWGWSFASHPDRAWARTAFANLWHSWERAAPFGRGDEWHPYVASLRAWALCGTYRALVSGSEYQADVGTALARHARFLRWHLERDVGGNHLVKNLKALVGLGLFLGDERILSNAVTQLQRQLPVQVLADGGHYERSPSYHCQVLGDLLDVAGLLAAAGRPTVPGLDAAIVRMQEWLGVMLMPDGDVPILNDCELVGRSRLSLLRPGPAVSRRLTVLSASGYVIVRPDERMHLVADVGDPCPSNLPAHAHADSLSFVLAVDGERVVVDGGTSTYEPGSRRAHERSTAAHNTVAVDEMDSTEVWGTFRAARIARARLERADDDGQTVSVVASHDGYRRLRGGPVHRRTWSVAAERVKIVDEIVGGGEHRIAARVHLSSGKSVNLAWSGPRSLRVSEGPDTYATGFGLIHEGHVHSAFWEGRLPVSLGMELHFDKPKLQSSSQ